MAMMKKSHLQGIVFGVFLAVVVIEVAARLWQWLPVPPPPTYYALRDALGQIPEPYTAFRYNYTGEFNTLVSFNYRSLRDIDHEIPRDMSKTRVLFVGDSYTSGWQVELNETFTALLRANHKGIDPINAGWHGWGTDRQYLYYLVDGKRYASDTVVLQLYAGNDVFENGLSILQSGLSLNGREVAVYPLEPFMPFFRYEGDTLQLTPPRRVVSSSFEQVQGVRSFLNQYSFTYRALNQFLSTLQRQPSARQVVAESVDITSATSKIPIEYYQLLPETLEEAAWQEAYAITFALLDAFKADVEASGATFLVILVDNRWFHDPAGWQMRREQMGLPTNLDIGLVGNIMRDYLKAQNITFLDLTPRLLAEENRLGEMLIFRKDGHWNKKGHCVVAQVVQDFLVQAQVLAEAAPILCP